MSNVTRKFRFAVMFCAVAALLVVLLAGCSAKEATAQRKKMQPGQEFTGFLTAYDKLAPNPSLDGDALTYVNDSMEKHLRRYVGIIVDPVEIYLATDVDESDISEEGVEAVKAYFRTSLIQAVSDAYPVVEQPGPLILRLRSALAGVDVGDAVARSGGETGGLLGNSITIGEVFVEVELVDSQTGELIAAAVDRANLGTDAEIGAANFSKIERFEAARAAFRGWAERIRLFFDSECELAPEEVDAILEVYQPYGG